MIAKITQKILKKSPWDDDGGEENIFTKKRNKSSSFKAPNLNDLPFKFDAKTIFVILVILAGLWLSSGIFKVQEGEQAVVMRFGKFDRIAHAGLNYHLPNPLETIQIELVNKSRRIEIGYRSGRLGNTLSNRDIAGESIMLTGDENIIELNVDVMWSISDLPKYVFKVMDPEDTVKSAAESSIRDVIGNTAIASILSNRKQEISEKIENQIQQILDAYETGVKIDRVELLKAEPPKEVLQAYRDVQTSRADKEREINQALSYSNDIIPKARGQAAIVLQQAEGYKAEVVAKAKGDAARFDLIFKQYVVNKEVMRNRLFLETVEEVMSGVNKTVIGAEGMLPHMALKTDNSHNTITNKQ